MISHIFITVISLMVDKKIPDGRNKHPLNNYALYHEIILLPGNTIMIVLLISYR